MFKIPFIKINFHYHEFISNIQTIPNYFYNLQFVEILFLSHLLINLLLCLILIIIINIIFLIVPYFLVIN